MRLAPAIYLAVGMSLVGQTPDPIQWEKGPVLAKIGTIAEIKVPKGMMFTGVEGAKKFMILTQNIPNGQEVGVLIAPKDEDAKTWFVIFRFDPIGYVKDDEKNTLDADAILTSIRNGTSAANDQRRAKGWPTMVVKGWHRPPFYDIRNNNLTWAILGRASDENTDVVNHSVRILGRSGYVKADLISSVDHTSVSIAEFESTMSGFQFARGEGYREFKQGDKVAAIGLTALVAGGAGAVLAKAGLLEKFWKVIVAGVVAAAAAVKKLFNRIFNRGKDESEG